MTCANKSIEKDKVNEILQLEDGVQCIKCHEYSNCGVTCCDRGRILKGINAQIHDQVCVIITDKYKTMVILFGLVWKPSLAGRVTRITDSKESQEHN